MPHRIKRTHEICAGHRVYGHESKCAHLHGHAYVFDLVCEAPGGLDHLGRVIDFGVIKSRLCSWLEDHWDHRMLLWEQDPACHSLRLIDPEAVVPLPLNPTAENLASMFVMAIAPELLLGTGVVLTECTVHETSKCSATYTRRS